MEISIYDAKTHLSNLIQQLVDEKEEIIYISCSLDMFFGSKCGGDY